MRRRRRRKMEENHPYYGTSGSSRSRNRSDIVSEILETFEEYPVSTTFSSSHYGPSTSETGGSAKRGLLPFSMSLVSSNLSRNWSRSGNVTTLAGDGVPRAVQDSSASVANPLSVPPLWRKGVQHKRVDVNVKEVSADDMTIEKPTLAARREASDSDSGTLVPRLKPLKAPPPPPLGQSSPRNIRWPSSPKWPRSPGSPKWPRSPGSPKWARTHGMAAKTEAVADRKRAPETRDMSVEWTNEQGAEMRDSLDYYIYESIGGGRNDRSGRIGRAL